MFKKLYSLRRRLRTLKNTWKVPHTDYRTPIALKMKMMRREARTLKKRIAQGVRKGEGQEEYLSYVYVGPPVLERGPGVTGYQEGGAATSSGPETFGGSDCSSAASLVMDMGESSSPGPLQAEWPEFFFFPSLVLGVTTRGVSTVEDPAPRYSRSKVES